MADYDCGEIQVLKGLEGIRRRPGMYVGDLTRGRGMFVMLRAVIDNAIDEHLAGHATYCRVTVEDDVVTVEDDGRGIPVDVVPTDPPMPALQAVLTMLHAGRGFDRNHWRGSMFGLGLGAINALSAWLEVEVWRRGRRYHQRHERGEPCGPIRDLGPTSRTGTRIRLSPDFSIHERAPWDLAAIGRHLRAVAALVPGLTTVWQHEAVRTPGGLTDLARHLAGDAALHDPLRIRGDRGPIEVNAALVWTRRPDTAIHGYLNRDAMVRGSHVDGIEAGVRRAFRRLERDRLATVHASAFGEVMMPGLVAVVHVLHPEPRYAYDGGIVIDDPQVRAAVRATIASGLGRALTDAPDVRRTLVARLP